METETAQVVLTRAVNLRYKDGKGQAKELPLRAGVNTIPAELVDHPYLKALAAAGAVPPSPKTQKEVQERLEELANVKLKADLESVAKLKEEAEEDRKAAAKLKEDAEADRAEAAKILDAAKNNGNGKGNGKK